MTRLFVAALGVVPLAALAVPLQLSHTARLVDALGTPINGAHTLTVALYDELGAVVHDETLPVTVADGYVTVVLGANPADPLQSSDLQHTEVWVGLTVDSGPELSPRQRLLSAPYAVRADYAASAGNADTVDNLDASQLGVPSGAVMAFAAASCPSGWVAADGGGGRPDLRGRFPIGVGAVPNSGGASVTLNQTGGSARNGVSVSSNQFPCCSGDQGIHGAQIHWEGEGSVARNGENDGGGWTATAWMTHLPPYAAVLWCVKS
jgi:hypothetical protein